MKNNKYIWVVDEMDNYFAAGCFSSKAKAEKFIFKHGLDKEGKDAVLSKYPINIGAIELNEKEIFIEHYHYGDD